MPVTVPEQPTLKEGAPASSGQDSPPAGATPAEGIAYDSVRGDIEKDIRDWERADGGARRKARQPKKRPGSRKKKTEEGPGTEAS